MKSNSSFGSWLKMRRKALDLTQTELADQVGCAVVTIQKFERDIARPSKQMTERLADTLAISVDERASFTAFARHAADSLPVPPASNGTREPSSHLPHLTTPFVGRHSELAQIADHFKNPDCRLLTLVGEGGIGKTRLAVQAAREHIPNFTDGVHFVPLAPVRSSDMLALAIASVLHVPFHGSEPPFVQLLSYLHAKKLLLVLDNFEHLLDGAPQLSELLMTAPGLILLITSREPLNLQGEWVFQIEGMDYPRQESVDSEPIETYSAVQLFVQSAQRVQVGFSLNGDRAGVLRICQLVEGMPLAILLAAAWVEVLTLPDIAAEIQKSLDFLEADQQNVPERQRSLRATLDYSWQMLPQIERDVLARLSIFRGGFSRGAAQEVTGASLQTLLKLVNKSLLRRDSATGRYGIHELLRRYSEERLELSADKASAYECHCSYYANFLYQSHDRLRTGRQGATLRMIEIEIDNIRTAWQYMVKHRRLNDLRKAMSSLSSFYSWRGWRREGLEFAGQVVKILRLVAASAERDVFLGDSLAEEAGFYAGVAQVAVAQPLIEESLSILRRYDCPEEICSALATLNQIRFQSAAFDPAIEAAREGLKIATSNGLTWWQARHLYNLGRNMAEDPTRLEERQQIGEECLRLAEECGDLSLMAGTSFVLLGGVALDRQDYTTHEGLVQQGLVLYEEIGDRWGIAACFRWLGWLALQRTDYVEAESYFRKSLSIFVQLGTTDYQIHALSLAADLYLAKGRKEAAVELLVLIDNYPKSAIRRIRDSVVARLAYLQTELPPQVFSAAQERAQSLELESLTAEILASPPLFPTPPHSIA